MRSSYIADRRHFIVAAGAALLSGCAAHSTTFLPSQTRGPRCNNYQSNGRFVEGARSTECVTGAGGSLIAKGMDSATPMTAADQQFFDTHNIDRDSNGNPIVRRPNPAGGFSIYPVTGGVTVYKIDNVDSGTATTILNNFQSYLNNIDYSGASADDAQFLGADIAAANAAIQAAIATLAPADLANASTAVGRVRNDLPYIGGTHNKPYGPPTVVILDWWNYFRPQYADRNAMERPGPHNNSCKTQSSTMKRIAAAALDMNGMDTSGAPGAGTNACAWAIENAIYNVLGYKIAGGSGNPNWVPDVTKGLVAAGWIVFDDPSKAMPGDIAVQNGQGDGGTPGAPTQYENHIGAVVNNPNDPKGGLAIMNNSSSNKSFTNFDKSMAFAGYYSGTQDGPARFYRVPAQGISNQPTCIGP